MLYEIPINIWYMRISRHRFRYINEYYLTHCVTTLQGTQLHDATGTRNMAFYANVNPLWKI